jgi:hypothetical protein
VKIVYLDQNKWIDLARVAYGKVADDRLANALDVARKARDMKLASFPTSFGHLMETHRSRKLDQRGRLAEFMLELSGGLTFCPFESVLRYEIDQALWDRFGDRIDPRKLSPLNLVGHGFQHASGGRGLSKKAKDVLGQLPLPYQDMIERWFEKGMLSGVSPDIGGISPGVVAPRIGAAVAVYEEKFVEHLAKVHEFVSPVKDEGARDMIIRSIALLDIWEEVKMALARLGLPESAFTSLREDQLLEFVDALPTRHVEIHLHRHWARNKQLKETRSALIDWGQTAPMAMYADVVVTEKKLANLLNRPGLRKKAAVITDLGELPNALIGT